MINGPLEDISLHRKHLDATVATAVREGRVQGLEIRRGFVHPLEGLAKHIDVVYEVNTLQSQAKPLADSMSDQHQMIDLSLLIFVSLSGVFHLLLFLPASLLLKLSWILGFTRKRGHLPL